MDRLFSRQRVGAKPGRGAIALLSAALVVGASSGAVLAQDAPTTIENIKVAGAGPVLTLDVTKSGDLVSVDTIILSQGSLVRHDANGVPQLELAESITSSEDGKTVTIKLKPDLLYSDGTPVTAEDIKVAVERQLGEATANKIFISSIESAEVIDDLTAQLNLKYADPDLWNGLSARALALNPADAVTNDPDYFLHPVSAGPYMVTEYTPNSTLHLAANPNYVGGPMVVQGIDVMYVPDLSSKVLQLATGAIDFAWDLPIAAKDSFPPEVKQFIVNVGGANTLLLNMDPAGPAGTKFADPRVRQAMSLAIDRQAVADKAFLGLVSPLTSFWYDCGPELCPPNMLPNGGIQDVEAAKALMAEAGVDTIDAELLVSSTRGGWKEAATLIAADLAEIGVNLTVSPVDEATWNGAQAKGNFQAIYNGGASTPQITVGAWMGDGNIATASGYAKTERHPEMVALIEAMAQELDPAKRLEIHTELQTLAAETMPMISIVDRIALDGTRLPDGVLSVAQLTPGYMILQTQAEAAAGKAAGQP
jgi:peptide/nickel transport system substrate-binding protein